MPQYSTVGLPEEAVKESKYCVKSAIKNSGYDFPARRITINLATADIRKDDAAFYLPIAIGLLAATGVVDPEALAPYALLDELYLDGRVKPVRGVLPIAVAVRDWGDCALLLPTENAEEGTVVAGPEIFPVADLAGAVSLINGTEQKAPYRATMSLPDRLLSPEGDDFLELRGQEYVKRALEVAAASSHNIPLPGGCRRSSPISPLRKLSKRPKSIPLPGCFPANMPWFRDDRSARGTTPYRMPD